MRGILKVELKRQVVLVTGAGRGIGREVSLMAAEAGASVVLAARTESQLIAVADAIRQRDGSALVVPTDMMDREAILDLVRQTVETYGRIDVLVNNAATNYIANLVLSKEEKWRELYELNVFSVFRLTKAVIKHMIRARSGRIINISSTSAKIGAAFNSAYASSKGAINSFTKSLAKETARLGITVNAVCPWHVETELAHFSMGQRAKMFGKTSEAYLAEVVQTSPQKRSIEAREVAALTLYLMSPDAKGITGQTLNVCGGVVME